MRKLLISILLAGIATSPAFAQDRHRDAEDRSEQREERQQQREERQQAREQAREQRQEPARIEPRSIERVQPQLEVRERSFDRGANVDATARANRVDIEQLRAAREGDRRQRADGTSRWTRDNVQQPGETSRWVRDPGQRAGETSRWTRDRTGWTGGGELRRGDRPVPNVMRSPSPLIVSDAPREGTQPRLRGDSRRRVATNWTQDWRRDGRYDWRRHRDRNRSIFHIGFYYDPFGWNYRPYQIGWRLWPSYYSSRYWINDPWYYRLPYAPPGTVWIRYWDDAILVDRFTGEVVDVIHNFFW
jgi:Ni/Co efflux regulator RcnB